MYLSYINMKDFKNEVDASFIQPMFHFRRERESIDSCSCEFLVKCQ